MLDPAKCERAAEIINDHAKRVLAFTGAGISKEAGIPTFRGEDGLWRKYRAEDLATPEAFDRNPRLVWGWYRWRMGIISKAKPTLAHNVLAHWEEEGILMGVVTQNVDGLHRLAGSKRLVELHGNIWRMRCSSCGRKVDLGFGNIPDKDLPICESCGSLMRPDVVWFGEPLPMNALMEAEAMFNEAEVVLVVGTSGVVMPAALFPIRAAQEGKILIEVNPEATNLSRYSQIVLRSGAGEAFDCLSRLVEGRGWR